MRSNWGHVKATVCVNKKQAKSLTEITLSLTEICLHKATGSRSHCSNLIVVLHKKPRSHHGGPKHMHHTSVVLRLCNVTPINCQWTPSFTPISSPPGRAGMQCYTSQPSRALPCRDHHIIWAVRPFRLSLSRPALGLLPQHPLLLPREPNLRVGLVSKAHARPLYI